ncbi:hypothetical protein COEX109129_29025 [Corallococcus exiguus]
MRSGDSFSWVTLLSMPVRLIFGFDLPWPRFQVTELELPVTEMARVASTFTFARQGAQPGSAGLQVYWESSVSFCSTTGPFIPRAVRRKVCSGAVPETSAR